MASTKKRKVLGCPAGFVIVTIVCKLGYFTYLRDLPPTYIGVIIHLLTCMDTLVPSGKRSHSWLEYPPFLIGNTSTQSGSIFQPAMLDDPSVGIHVEGLCFTLGSGVSKKKQGILLEWNAIS